MSRGMRINFGSKGYTLEAHTGRFFYAGVPVTIAPRILPRVGSQSLPAATQNVPYSFSFQVAGGVGPYTIKIVSVAPDTGNWLSATGGTTIGGTAGTAETESVTVVATDAHGVTSPQANFSLVVNPNHVTTGTVYNGQVVTLPAPSGGGFGAKSRALAPILSDQGVTPFGSVDPQWDGAGPASSTTAYAPYNMALQPAGFQDPAGFSPGLPNAFVGGVYGGAHESDNAPWSVYLAKGLTAPGYPFAFYARWLERMSPNIIFGQHSPADDNCQVFAYGTTIGGPPAAFVESQFSPPGPSNTTDATHQTVLAQSVSGPLESPDRNGYTFATPGAGTQLEPNVFNVTNGWRQVEMEVCVDTATGAGGHGRWNRYVNGVQTCAYAGCTDNFSGSQRYLIFGAGLYSRDYGDLTGTNGNGSSNWSFQIGHYIDQSALSVTQVARCMFCDQATYAASKIRVPGIIQAWADNSITVEFLQDMLQTGKVANVSVVTEAGTVIDGVAQLTIVAQPVVNTFNFYVSPTGSDAAAGSLVAPWAITSFQDTNPNNAKMAGQRVGLLPGTYNVAALKSASNPSNAAYPALHIPAGTNGSPTYVASCDATGAYAPRGAVLLNKGSTSVNAVIGQDPISPLGEGLGYWTLDGIVVNGGAFAGNLIQAAYSATQTGPGSVQGVTVENVEAYGVAGTAAGVDNAAIYLSGCLDHTVQNNYLHDVQKPSQPTTASGYFETGCTGGELLYNTVYNTSCGMTSRAGGAGTEIGFNYFYACPTAALQGFDGATGNPNKPPQPHSAHNNIFDACGPVHVPTLNGSYTTQPINFWNNTIRDTRTGTINLLDLRAQAAVVQSWNNIFSTPFASGGPAVATGGSPVGIVSFTAGTYSILDGNCYDYFSPTNGWGLSGTTYSGLGTWAPATGQESHSIAADPLYVGPLAPGTGPNQFVLATGSPCIGAGRQGYDMGAWGGLDDGGFPIRQIGASWVVYPPAVSAPQSLYQGATLTTDIIVTWMPPLTGPVPDGYNVYINGAKVNAALVTLWFNATQTPQLWYRASALTPNTKYAFNITAVANGVESGLSPTLNITTLAIGAPATPTPPTDPATWLPAYSLPTGTVHVCTNNTQFLAALAAANINGGDVIACTNGVTFGPQTIALPEFTGTNGWTYIVSTQDPGYNGSGTLPALKLAPSSWQTPTLSAAPALGATSATLSSAWTGRTGLWITSFQEAAGTEFRTVEYTNGSTAISWTGGALAAAASATIAVLVGNYVTPMDAASMPTFQFDVVHASGIGLSIPANCQKVRFVGINFAPAASDTSGNLFDAITFKSSSVSSSQVPSDSVYFDRCLIGNDSTISGFSWVRRGILVQCDHFAMTQCYAYGFFGGNGPDANCVNIIGGGPGCIRYNYLEAASEHVLSAGAYTDPLYVPHDWCRDYNDSFKQPLWATESSTIATEAKNHFEHKVCLRGTDHDNNCFVHWWGAEGGQHGRVFVYGARDQVASNNAPFAITGSITGNVLTFNGWTSGAPSRGIVLQSLTNPGLILSGTGLPTGTAPGCCVVSLLSGTLGQAGSTYLLSVSIAGTISTGISGTVCTDYQGTCPWSNISDLDNYNNAVYQGASLAYVFTGDSDLACSVARVRFRNNFMYANPPVVGGENSPAEGRCFWIAGPCADLIIDHTTFVLDPANVYEPQYTAFIWVTTGVDSGINYSDRVQITNNAGDGHYFVTGDNVPTGATALTTFFKNLTFGPNLSFLDTNTTYPGTFYPNVAYASAGFLSWPGSNAIAPVPPSDLNITTGTYATASSSKGPLGCTFPVGASGFAAALYPRSYLLAISGQSSYSSAAFKTAAAKFNIVEISAYIGIEQDIGETLESVRSTIAAGATANGITSYQITYLMDQQSAESTGSGNQNTYANWISQLNTNNWWLRSSYPSGAIVSAGSNTGVTNNSNQNTVKNSAGRTFAQQFAYYFWNVYTQGTAVSLFGEAHSIAASPSLDGWKLDNQAWNPTVAGAWADTTTSYNPTTQSATTYPWQQKGHANTVAALRAQGPGLFVIGNLNFFNFLHATPASQIDPSNVGLWDGVFCEEVIGGSGTSAVETFAGPLTAMANLIASEPMIKAGGVLILHQDGRAGGVPWTSQTSQASWQPADWQSARYGAAMAAMRGYPWSCTPNTYSAATVFFYDELEQGGVLGWLGTMTDAPQTAAVTNATATGVWACNYQNGLSLWNPRGNGPQTFTITRSGLKHLTNNSASTGDPTVNTGAAVGATVTLPDASGLFLIT